jgi:glycosyltransferase involved in cell wall biosynthesis
MNVFVLAPQENWICDRLVHEWKRHTDTHTSDILKSDIIWLLAGWCWNQIHPDILRQKKVVVTEHHIVPEKFWAQKADMFKIRDQFVDAYHTPNIKTATFIRSLTDKPIHVIPYWLDTDLWFSEDKNHCREIFNIPANKFVVGSFQRDTEGGTRLPKLEKGPDLFVQYLCALNRDDLYVLLGGWRREYICDKLDEHKIPYSKFEQVPIDIVRKMYGACDLYVVSSRYEGGPQAIYEAAAAKVPIISRDVGVATEILCENCIVDIPNEVYYPTPEDVEMNFKNVLSFDIKQHKNVFHKMLEEV